MGLTVLYANDENIGDLLSARGIQSILKGSARLHPFEGRRAATARMLDHLGPDDTLVIGGGGLLKSTFDRTWEQVLEAQRRRGFASVLWGIGFCNVIGRTAQGDVDLHREAVSRARASTFRDHSSLAPFADLSNTQVMGCPSVVAVREALRGRAPRAGGVRALQVDHPDLLRSITDRYGIDAEEAVSRHASEWAGRRGIERVRITNLVPALGVPPRLRARLAVSRWESRRAAALVTAYVRHHYADAEVVVTSRLHGAIIAAAAGRRIVALSGDTKISEFMESVGLGRYVVEDPGQLGDAFERLDVQPSTEHIIDDQVEANLRFARSLTSPGPG